MATLLLSNVSKSFGKTPVLKNVSLAVSIGEIVALYGRNGCGKSTLLKLLFGTLSAKNIKLNISGVPITPKAARLKKQIAYIPQHSFLPMSQKVRDIIPMYYVEEEKQDKVFYDPYIATFTDLKVAELSIGQRRYFEVVLVGNNTHPFILLDEPFSMIDPLHKERLKDFITQLKSKKGILITDHYYNDVMAIASKHKLLKDGELISITSIKDLVTYKYLNRT